MKKKTLLLIVIACIGSFLSVDTDAWPIHGPRRIYYGRGYYGHGPGYWRHGRVYYGHRRGYWPDKYDPVYYRRFYGPGWRRHYSRHAYRANVAGAVLGTAAAVAGAATLGRHH